MRLRDRLAAAEAQVEAQAAQIRTVNDQLTQRSLKLRQCATAYRDSQTKIAELEREIVHHKAAAAASNQIATRLLDQIAALTKDLTRSPEVLSEAILTGISGILNGYATAAAETREEVLEQNSMGSLGLGNDGGVPAGHFFPDVEFDEFMEQREQWPTPGMMTSSPVIPGEGQHPVHQIANGEVARMDGQPMFQAGTSGKPPVGGIE